MEDGLHPAMARSPWPRGLLSFPDIRHPQFVRVAGKWNHGFRG